MKWVDKPMKERTMRKLRLITRYIPWNHQKMGEVELEDKGKLRHELNHSLSKLDQESNNPGVVGGQTYERKNTEELLIDNKIHSLEPLKDGGSRT
jgi:hypothetical protein